MIDRIVAEVESNGGRAYFVGGCVRDEIMGAQSKDIDVEVYGLSAGDLASILSRFGRVDIVGVSFGVIKLTVGSQDYDFSLPRRDSKIGAGHRGFSVEVDHTMTVEAAAARRDYTMNAISQSIGGDIIDPYNGIGDIRRRMLRHVSPAFADDPLRVLRGMQFAGRYNMTVTRETAALCRSLRGEYCHLAGDRIWGEWHKWAAKSIKPSAGLEFLYSSGWIYLYPELRDLIGLPQQAEWHPEGSVWQHTKHVCNAAASIAIRDGLNSEDRAILVFAGLCHDLGKASATIFADGAWRSPGHDQAGEPLARSFMESIGAPKRFVDAVAELTRLHMVHVHGNPTPRMARRLVAALQHISPDMLIRIIEADHSGRPPLPVGLPDSAAKLAGLMAEVKDQISPILMGRHLIQLGWTPGKELGRVLRHVYQGQLDGLISDLPGAISEAKKVRFS